jgi:hypothetical protein
MSWREAQLPMALAAMLLAAGSGLLAGCRHGQRETIPSQPFRDEQDGDDDFQYSEGAVPGGAEGQKAESSASAGESTVEIEIDEGSGDEADSDAAASGDDASDDDEGSGEGSGEDGAGDEGEGGGR